MLNAEDRLAMLLVERYEHYARQGNLYIKSGQQSIANATGLCLKTINRTVRKFTEEGLITRNGNAMQIDENQFQKLQNIVSAVMESE